MAKEFTYKLNIDADIGALTSKFKSLKETLSSITSDGKEPRLAKVLDQLGTHLDNIKSKANTPIKSEAAFGSMEKEIQTVYRLLESLDGEINSVSKKAASEKISFLPENEQKKLIAIVNAMKAYDSTIEASVKKSTELTKAEKDLINTNGTLEKQQRKLIETQKALDEAKGHQTAAKAALDEAKGRQAAAKAAEEQYQKILKLAEAKKKENSNIDLRSAKFENDAGEYITLAAARANVKKTADLSAADDINALISAYQQINSQIKSFNGTIGTTTAAIEKQKIAVNEAQEKVVNLTNAFNANKLKASAEAFNTLKQQAQDLGVNLQGIGSENTTENITLLKQSMEEFVTTGIEPANAAMQTGIQTTQEMNIATDQLANTTKKSAAEFKEQSEAAGEVKSLVNRIKQFTGLTGAALIARRALRNAINTIKELDKQMTEMAVVTNLEVGDYWKQLPEHTERANELGMAIKDVYQAETLYYQQGLKAAQVTQLSTSTLKMARIAGLSAEDATNKMTAALRGFNMEINQTNADRVADVYSKLAAITASNVQEISSAMTKTASIAANAGMEFETTAAFLSQIIETTRESAETAGTALKTVIARFQELKKSPDEIGEVDGEIIDANKIETALRSVGVALRDTQGQFRDLDDVFMELASKWNSLDMNTQRYIATIAAGSRQQSRFVAMMSNYARTQELVSAANNAAGASNEQFQKTLESLESKLAALKNAWDTFTMGIANSNLIKGAIDILTNILNGINKITEVFGEWPGLALKIGVVTTALIAGDKAIKAFMASMKLGNGILASFGAGLSAPLMGLVNFNKRLALGAKNFFSYSKSVIIGKTATEKFKLAQTNLTSAMSKQIVANNNLIAAKNKAKQANQHLTDLLSQEKIEQTELTFAKERARIATEEEAAAEKRAAIANEEVAKSEADLAMITGLSTEQLAASNAMVKLGVDEKTALWLASKGLNAEILQEFAARNSLTAAEVANIIAGKADAETKMGGWLASKLMTVALKLQAKGHIGATIATWLQVAATWALKASLGEIVAVILIVIAVIAILVIAIMSIISAIKKFKANTPEGKLNSINEALKLMSEEVKATQDAYNDLKDSLDSIQDQYNTLDNLIVGTREWRNALLEVNNQVLDLIDKYPELLQYVTKEKGLLVISDEGQQMLLDKQMIKVAGAQAAQLDLYKQKAIAEDEVNYSRLSKNVVAGGTLNRIMSSNFTKAIMNIGTIFNPAVSSFWNPVIDSYNTNTKMMTDQLAKALANGEIELDDNGDIDTISAKATLGVQNLDSWINRLNNDVNNAGEELRKYGQSLIQHEDQIETYSQGIIDAIVATLPTETFTTEELAWVSNIGNDKAYQATKQGIIEGLQYSAGTQSSMWKPSYITQNADYEKFWKEKMGQTIKITDKGAIQIQEGGKWTTKYDSKDAFDIYASALAVEKSGEKEYTNFIKELNNIAASLNKTADSINRSDVNKINFSAIEKRNTILRTEKGRQEAEQSIKQAYLDKEGTQLTRDNLQYLTSDILYEVFYKSSSDFQQAFNWSFDTFFKTLSAAAENANNAFQANMDKLAAVGINDFSFGGNVIAGTETGLINQLVQVANISGPEIAHNLGIHLRNILETVSEEDYTKIARQLSSIDWHSVDELEALPSVFKELGISIPFKELSELIDDLKESAQAIKNIDFEKLNEQLLSLNHFLKTLYSNDQGRIIDSSIYESIISVDPNIAKLFQQYDDNSYVFLGGMESLGTIIIQATNDLVDIGSKQLSDKINTASILNKLFNEEHFNGENSSVRSFKNIDKWSEEEKKQFLEELVSQGNQKGIKFTNISKFLSNDADNINNLDEDALKAIFEALKGLYGQETVLTNQLELENIAAYTKTYSSKNVYENASSQLFNKAIMGQIAPKSDDLYEFQGQRNAILIQAISAGLPEADLKKIIEWDKAMRQLEADGETGGLEYKKYSKIMSQFAKTLATKTGYQEMRNQLKETLERNKELIDSYKETTDVMQKMFLVKQMVQDFDIEITEKNYEYFAQLTDEYLHGNEESLKKLINFSAQAIYLTENTFDAVAGKTMEEISAFGQEYVDFVRDMINKGYGYWDEGRLVWGLQTVKDLAEEITEEIEKWVSPYDWLYNANKRINALMKQRNIYENEYQRMIEDGKASYTDIKNNLLSQVSLLQQEANANQHLYDGAKASLERYMEAIEENPELSSLQGAIAIGSAGQIVIDKEKLYNSDISADEGSVLEDVVSKIEEQIDTMTNALDDLNDNVDAIRKLRDTGKDEYKDLLSRIIAGLEKQYQDQIDKLTDINDSITNAQSALTDKIQEQIDSNRRARSNEKTEKSLTDKQARLNYLRASGGNALDILKLQQELKDEQETYQDTLVDQALNDLIKTNEQAADQRQTQIDIAQAQLDYWKEFQAETEADKILRESLQQIQNGTSPLDTKMGQLLYQTENVASMAPVNMQDWENALTSGGTLAAAYLDIISNSELGQAISNAEYSITTAYGTVKDDFTALAQGNLDLLEKIEAMTFPSATEWDYYIGQWLTELEGVMTAVLSGAEYDRDREKALAVGYQTYDRDANGIKNGFTPITAEEEQQQAEEFKNTIVSKYQQEKENTAQNIRNEAEALPKEKSKNIGNGTIIYKDEKGIAWVKGPGSIGSDGVAQYMEIEKYIARLNSVGPTFATGGLADFTGPAWLDGTKSAPELVLSAIDTANFIELKDILSEILRGSHDRAAESTSGNNYYDITVEVDSIDSDYGVDQAAERVRELIEEDAMYRNVTAVNKTR